MSTQIRALRQGAEQDILAVSDAALLRAMPDTLLVVDRAGAICLHHAGSKRNQCIDQRVDRASSLFELASRTQEPVWRTMLSRSMNEGTPLRDEAVFTEEAVSFEIRVVPYTDDHAIVLLRNEDTALVQADLGRNRISLYSGARSREHSEQLELQQELRRAIENDELELHFQPKLNLAPRFISGVEALVRWRHPRRGMVYPDQFIPVAESSGQIDALGDWVLHAACRQIRAWQSTPLADVRVAINLSTQQFRDSRLASRVLRSLTRYQLMPDSLDIELTESALMSDAETTIRSLARLKEAGIGIAIDDFGTGFSSLSYLTMLPLDAVKIDKSFVSNVEEEGSDLRSICTAVIAMAHSLGLYVIAEGVETEEQLQYLHFLDCDQVQGFHFAKPMSGKSVSEFILDHRAQYPRRALQKLT